MAGRRMTVHWEHAAALAEISPHLVIERTLYVIDRDRVTCAGGTAPMDLMHALITQHHGAPFARLASDWFLHTEVRPSGGPQRAGLVNRVLRGHNKEWFRQWPGLPFHGDLAFCHGFQQCTLGTRG